MPYGNPEGRSVDFPIPEEFGRPPYVMHIASSVSATIADGYDAVDVIDAVLPAGMLLDTPKLRACQIIQELEGAKRGIYGGAIGYMDLSGNLDIEDRKSVV